MSTTMQYRVAGLYQITKHLGFGSFGSVWQARSLITGSDVAIKVEQMSPPDGSPEVLPYEAAIYKQIGGSLGFPCLHWAGSEKDANVLVLDMVGVTLEKLRRFCSGRFSLKTTLMLADQMISRVEHLHSKGLIYRDFKPDNFAMGLGLRASVVHLFDFGLAKLYLDPSTGKHIPFREGLAGLGTPRYSSSNVHFGFEQGRRDDIESLGHVLVFLHRGSLPWQGIFAPDVQSKLLRIGEMKAGDPLCKAVADLAPEFGQYFDHCRSLQFEDRPDYDYLKSLFRSRMKAEGWEYDSIFDWTPGANPPQGVLYPPEKYVV